MLRMIYDCDDEARQGSGAKVKKTTRSDVESGGVWGLPCLRCGLAQGRLEIQRL